MQIRLCSPTLARVRKQPAPPIGEEPRYQLEQEPTRETNKQKKKTKRNKRESDRLLSEVAALAAEIESQTDGEKTVVYVQCTGGETEA